MDLDLARLAEMAETQKKVIFHFPNFHITCIIRIISKIQNKQPSFSPSLKFELRTAIDSLSLVMRC